MSETLQLTAADGHQFALTLEKVSGTAPLLLIGPAMGTPARVYAPLVEAFAKAGISAAVIELRGIGSSSLRASRAVDFGYRTLLEQDWLAAITALRARLPQAPLFLLGHSLGGQVSMMCAAAYPQGIAGAIIVAGGSVYFRGWKGARALGILAFTQFAGTVAGVVGYFPGKRLGFGGTEARTVMKDWARMARSGRFRLAGSGRDYDAAMTQMAVPVLGISFEHDSFAPHRAQKYLLDKLPAKRVTHLPLTARDTGDRLDHYNWIKKNGEVVRRIQGWVKEQAGVRP